MKVIINALSIGNTAFYLRYALGDVFDWHFRLADWRRGKATEYGGPVLNALRQKGEAPVYTIESIKEFVKAYRAYDRNAQRGKKLEIIPIEFDTNTGAKRRSPHRPPATASAHARKVRPGPVEGFQPLAPLALSITLETRHKWRERLNSLDRRQILDAFDKRFAAAACAPASRKAAFLIAGQLVQLGIPLCFWRHYKPKPIDELQVSQRLDMLVYDLLWLRRQYPDHKPHFRRSLALFGYSELKFHNEAAYAFYEGGRRAWEIVKSLGLTTVQQWECAWLRSVPINKQQAATNVMRDQVFATLSDDLKSARRTAAFTDEDARAALRRRHDLWLCARMDARKSATQLAARYEQLTGQPITRQVAAKHLKKVREVLAQNEMKYAT